MVFGPSDFWIVVSLYSVGQFFLNGPYSAVLFFVGAIPLAVSGICVLFARKKVAVADPVHVEAERPGAGQF